MNGRNQIYMATKQYRATSYDKYDKMYADKVRRAFNLLPSSVKAEFNAISGGLMADTHINRSGLLSAISAYQSQYVQKAKREYRGCNIHKDIYGWSYFSDTAFNYRPYQ